MDAMPADVQAEWLAFDLAMSGNLPPEPTTDTPPTDPRERLAWMLRQ